MHPKEDSLVSSPTSSGDTRYHMTQPGSTDSSEDAGGTMLSINFTTPPVGTARNERIKQMSQSHPAFKNSREIQGHLVHIQQSLRKMPGVAASASNQIVDRLKRIGQTINQESSQLVDAVSHMRLDQEENEKALARLSLSESLTKGANTDMTIRIAELEHELEKERMLRKQAELDAEKVMSSVQDLSVELQDFKDMSTQNHQALSLHSPSKIDEVVQRLATTIQSLEDQGTHRRSSKLLSNGNLQNGNLVQSGNHLQKGIHLQSGNEQSNQPLMTTFDTTVNDEEDRDKSLVALNHHLKYSGIQKSVAMDKYLQAYDPSQDVFSQQLSPPPRAPSVIGRHPNITTRKHEQHSQPFQHVSANMPVVMPARTPSRFGAFNTANGNHQSRSMSNGGSVFTSPHHRTPPRGQYQNGSLRCRANAPEFFPTNGYPWQDQSRPPSSFGMRNDAYSTRSATNGHYNNRFPEAHASAGGDFNNGGSVGHSNAIIHRNLSNPYSQPPPVIQLSERMVKTWRRQIDDIYGNLRDFVSRYAADAFDQDMVQKLRGTPAWATMLRVYHPLTELEASSYLQLHLTGEISKPCVVTRVFIDLIVNCVWVAMAWKNFDSESTYALMSVAREMEKAKGQPSHLKQPLLDRQASIIEAISKSPNAAMFYKDKVNELVNSLFMTVEPLLNPHCSHVHAMQALEPIAEMAWDLSCRILTSRLTFDFRFPEVGARFSGQSMVPVWPSCEASELQAKHWRVALVTTPVVTCRNDTGSNISAHSVSLADVICMN